MKRLLLLVFMLVFAAIAKTQTSAGLLEQVADFTGTCEPGQMGYASGSGTLWVCHNTGQFAAGIPQYRWVQVTSGAGGGGTVTTFGSGALPPLFTTTVTNPTTTPTQTFNLSLAPNNTIFSNIFGAPHTPQFNSIASIFAAGGGVSGSPCPPNQFYYNVAAGVLACRQPVTADISGYVAPNFTAGYWIKTADASLTNAQVMASLTTGLLLNHTITGIPTVYAGTSCTNQFVRSLDGSGSATCNSVANTDLVNNSTTVNGQTCTLGGTCTIPVGGVSGTLNHLAKFTAATTVGDSTAIDNGTDTILSPAGYDVAATGRYQWAIPNNAATGTVVNEMACNDGAGAAIICSSATASTNVPFGVSVNGIGQTPGTTGTTGICSLGFCTVVFDNVSVTNHYAQMSTTVDGDLHDVGATAPTNGQPYWVVSTGNAAPGLAVVRTMSYSELNAAGASTQILINGVNAKQKDNFNNTTPVAPTNGINVQFQKSDSGNTSSISAALVGDGNAAHFLDGTGSYSTPPGGVTQSGGTAGYIPMWGVVPNLVNSHLDDGVTTASTITSTEALVINSGNPSQVSIGTDNTNAGVLITSNGSAAAHTTWGSAATTSNTILGPATVVTNAHLLTCTTSGTTCTLTDGGAVPTGGATPAVKQPLQDGTPDATGNVFWNVVALTSPFMHGHWEWDKGNSVKDLSFKFTFPHVLPGSGSYKVILQNLASNDNTAGHTATFKWCDALVSTIENPGTYTCTATQNFSTTTTAYAPATLTFAVGCTPTTDAECQGYFEFTASSGLVANVITGGIFVEVQ